MDGQRLRDDRWSSISLGGTKGSDFELPFGTPIRIREHLGDSPAKPLRGPSWGPIADPQREIEGRTLWHGMTEQDGGAVLWLPVLDKPVCRRRF